MDDFDLVLCLGLFLVVCFCAVIFYGISYEYYFSQQPSFVCNATLLNQQVIPSTTTHHFGTSFRTDNKSSNTYFTSHTSEIHITLWDCGKYGKLKSECKEVWRWSKHESQLLLKQYGTEVRIYGIIH